MKLSLRHTWKTYMAIDIDKKGHLLYSFRYICCHTLKISAILRCCGSEQWFSMDRMTGMSELTNADRLTASTTSWKIMGEI